MNKELTEIAYILDRSGSMHSITESAIAGFNSFLKDQQDTPGEANFTLVLFDDEYQLHADRTPISEVRPLDANTYVPRGSTALLDAIGRTINNIGIELEDTPENERPGKVIFAIYTDGYENASREFTATQISNMIRHQTKNYAWEFLFLAANEDAIATATSYGIDRATVSQVEYSTAGKLSSASSFSRKITGHRKMMQGCATVQELQDLDTDLEQIVREETAKFGK